MATIELDNFYLNWVNEHVRPAVESAGAQLSDAAAELLAYTLQAQVKERFVSSREHAVSSAEELLRFIQDGYWPPFLPFGPLGPHRSKVNFNVALHLMVDLNRLAVAFPWKPTD